MRPTRVGVAGVTLVLTIAACALPPVRYYTLATEAPPPSTAQATRKADGMIYFAVSPVGVPERLARPQIVVRSGSDAGSSQVSVYEQQRWSSSFDNELRDVFGAAIAARVAGIDVTRGGQVPGQPIYRVAIQLLRFDATLDKQVDAAFGWTITRSDDARNAVCQLTGSQPIGPGMDDLVGGIQRLVASAADRIATQIAQLQKASKASCHLP